MNEHDVNKNSFLQTYYFIIVDLWHKLCESHSQLLDLTCEEYGLLISSELDKLEILLSKKSLLLTQIENLEKLRTQRIQEINLKLSINIGSVKELLEVMSEFEARENQKHLWRFNQILIDIIEKIQLQNKKNQIFIKKASIALDEIKSEVLGQKNYTTYNSEGRKTRSTNNRSMKNRSELIV